MPSPESLRRLANLTREVRNDLRRGGMGVTFRYLFRSNAILARVVEILADHVATEAEERARAEGKASAGPPREDEADAEIRRLERKAERLGK
ncbi:MAG: hypothetical protein AB7T63_08510 [Planctomycetota bacterium]